MDALLSESDSIRRFVAECTARGDGNVTSHELVEAYFHFCANNEWTPQPVRVVERTLADAILETHGASRAQDIGRAGRSVRGWRNVILTTEHRRMSEILDITAAIASFQPLATPQNLNKRTVRTVPFPPSRVRSDPDTSGEDGKNVQGLTTHPSEPSETGPVLPPDQAAWLPVARQILGGEFDGADSSTRNSVTIGLRPIRHPACESALRRLWPKHV